MKEPPAASRGPGAPGGPSHEVSPLAIQMLNSIHELFAQPLTVKLLAARLGRHPSYLSFLFTHTFGVSFRSYLNQLRLRRAVALLADLNRPVWEIAYAVGFTDAHEFDWAFRRWTGLSPTAWRAAHREAALRPGASLRRP